MHYLDYAATTPILDEVLEAMMPFQAKHFGNPSSVYAAGREAKKGLEEAREQMAEAIGAQPSEIVFTGGGTEADNLALKGAALKASGGRPPGKPMRVVATSIEHHAVLHSVDWLERLGFDVQLANSRPNGLVDVDHLASLITPETILVSVMLVNNEVGTIQPLREISALVRAKSRALVHTDAVQALGKIPVDVVDLQVDLAAFSAHKLGGPKGTGALFVRRKTPLEAVIHGGGQERDLRSGTPNVAGIVGLAAAAKIAAKEVEEESERLAKLRDRLQADLTASVAGIQVNAADAPRISGTLNVCVNGVEGESLLLMLDRAGIWASSGSACQSGSLDPSHVLKAMGIPKQVALGSLRLSLGRGSTDDDVDQAMAQLPPIVERLRSARR
ncbi:MAG: cysteine desulfurase family protein [Actinomycetota bacterium]